MATTVTQVTPVDASLAGNVNYAFFKEYIIGLVTYVFDSSAQVIYEFVAGSGALTPTNGSYAGMIAFLVANPVSSVITPPPFTPAFNSSVLAISTDLLDATGVTSADSNGLIYSQTPGTLADQAVVQRLDILTQFIRGIYFMQLKMATEGPNPASDTDFFEASEATATANGATMWQ